jgi:tRNA uridine 5-carbamoylmethylation protein Kti12
MATKPRVIAFYGLPRSGKSTLGKVLSQQLNAPIVSRDCVRLALHGQRYEALAEGFVKAIATVMIRALVEAGHQTIIVDETHYSKAARKDLAAGPWDVYWYPVETTPEICKARAVATQQPDLLPVIDSMWARREPLDAEELTRLWAS